VTSLRVWLCTTTFLPFVGGVERGVLALARRLRERSVEATVLTFRHHREATARGTIDDVPVVRVAGALLTRRQGLPRPVRRGFYALASLQMAWRLWRARGQYDLVHLVQLSPLVLPIAFVCWMAHRSVAVTLAGVPGDVESVTRLGTAATRLARRMLRLIDAVMISPSTRGLRSLAEHDFLLPGSRIIPAPGVDIERFGMIDDRTLPARSRTVVCVAQFRPEKGLDVLLHAWRLVVDRRPDARLIIVGGASPGGDDVGAMVARLMTELGLGPSVELAGLRDDVPAQLHRGAIAVLPSRSEGLPNALLEAMACGLACVATRVSGSEDLIEHEVNGLLVEVEDPPGTARGLLRLLEDPDLARRYGQAARRTIERGYTADHVVDSYLTVYADLVRTRRGAAHASVPGGPLSSGSHHS
jgi:glycosyltransferase involved in cell wall biosynthesis